MRRQLGDALHDDVLQELYAAKLDLGNAERDSEAVPRARVAVDAATRQLRAAVTELHPAVSWTRDLDSRLRAILDQAGERAGLGHRLECSAETSGRTSDLLISLMRELVQNVVKHAQATFIVASVKNEGELIRIEVSDDGRGMPENRPEEALRAGHVGLASARERVEALGGRFTIDTGVDRGTRVSALIPRLS
jgi:two-component system NarL family sensor kinase